MLFCSFDVMLSFSLQGEEATVRAALPALRKSPSWNSTPTVQYSTVGGPAGNQAETASLAAFELKLS
jgi:hypothetical protein